jgi:hypothetical protein
MRMITRMSPNDTVLSPSNKTASKQTPHHALGRGVHGAGLLDRRQAISFCNALCGSGQN